MKKVLKLKKLNPTALRDAVAASSCGGNGQQPCAPTPTTQPRPYYSSY